MGNVREPETENTHDGDRRGHGTGTSETDSERRVSCWTFVKHVAGAGDEDEPDSEETRQVTARRRTRPRPSGMAARQEGGLDGGGRRRRAELKPDSGRRRGGGWRRGRTWGSWGGRRRGRLQGRGSRSWALGGVGSRAHGRGVGPGVEKVRGRRQIRQAREAVEQTGEHDRRGGVVLVRVRGR